MTFNEFLMKKKIDSGQFNKAEPGLFSEFEIHFSQMGEKSFDHSKKFWFNKLRRRFHLAEVPKPAKEPIEINELAAQAEPLISPTITASGVTGSSRDTNTKESPIAGEESSKPAYKPRFKAAAGDKSSGEQSSVSTQDELKDKSSNSSAPPAYKPRFKAPVKDNTPDSPQSDSARPGQEESKRKPAYKPRFNPATLNAAKEQEGEEKTKEAEKEPGTKPAYVPRFRASNLAPKVEPPKEVEEEVKAEPARKDKPVSPTEASPKPAYKPRFKPGLTKPKDTD